ncbi:5-oxoprolinase subunit PxpA [Arthrobacter sp. FW306-2-2C-D06B]|uniref:5-oxoprolinase subunit PxpA n=1 Tax=Arthrobacter sp. FW306-2-2C-D06B TaxID=2879618 RepID=UPI001F000132|nr:5-oxoprolinase subunit PxpA [Arthrobacter sp. FW306-2-2C-D06B]UKA60577.1 5-oxoprolinase subunit PxpA [Arthrobacter sp. FW306-2-2C-D06B]
MKGKTLIPQLTLNSDMGESYGIHSFGNDEALLPLVDSINVACGMHAGDPSTMNRIVAAAASAGVRVGAHPGLPDPVGFGRREMVLRKDEVRDLVRYQVGALWGFLDSAGVPLNHIKPHGALFAMLSRSEELMDALCDVAEQFNVPVYGLPATCHETTAARRGIPFIGELYVDLDYNADGTVIVNRSSHVSGIAQAVQRTHRYLEEGTIASVTGETVRVRADTICIHSDQSNSVELATAVRKALND